MSANIRREFKPDFVNGVPSIKVSESNRRISDSLLTISRLNFACSLTDSIRLGNAIHLSCHTLATCRCVSVDCKPIALYQLPCESCLATAPCFGCKEATGVKMLLLGCAFTGSSSSSR